MKKGTILKTTAVLFVATLALASCSKNKCYECHYDNPDGSIVDIGEYCGEDAENVEASGYNVNGEVRPVHCGEH